MREREKEKTLYSSKILYIHIYIFSRTNCIIPTYSKLDIFCPANLKQADISLANV